MVMIIANVRFYTIVVFDDFKFRGYTISDNCVGLNFVDFEFKL